MKNYLKYLLTLSLLFGFISCSGDDSSDSTDDEVEEVIDDEVEEEEETDDDTEEEENTDEEEDTEEETSEFTIWDGESIEFTKEAGADPTLEANQDVISDNVAITRGNTGGQIYNILQEDAADMDTSPVGTEWAVGDIADIESLEFEPFRLALEAADYTPRSVVGVSLIMHLVAEDVYLTVEFTSWDTGASGGFSYTRSTQP